MIHFKTINGLHNNGFKYQLLEDFERPLGEDFVNGWWRHACANINGRGILVVYEGYKWDGASGAIDSATFMEGSCIHDVLCDMMNNGTLERKMWIPAAKVMRETNKRERMPFLRRQWTYWAVVMHGVRTWDEVKLWA